MEPETMRNWKEFRAALRTALKFKRRTNNWDSQHLKQPFGIFDEFGTRLASVEGVVEARLIFVIEGGQWFWPPKEVGYVRKLPGTTFELETLSVQPVIFKVRGFLHDDECEKIIGLGKGRMRNSPVSLMDKDKGKAAKEFRTSTQAQISSKSSTVLQDIDTRIAHLTKVPAHHNEEVQILRYEKTQYYSAHLDNWDPQYYGSNTGWIEGGHYNRLITVFWYLVDVAEGGETIFPRAEGLPQPHDMYSCEKGLKVRPERGSVIFWYSLHPNGNTNPNGLHGACPVENGQKWSANYWVWNKPKSNNRNSIMPDWGLEDENDNDGSEGAETKQVGEGEQVSVLFENQLHRKVFLFWRSNDGNRVPLGPIEPQMASSMNSYPGHIWDIMDAPENGAILQTFTMSRDAKQRYKLESSEL